MVRLIYETEWFTGPTLKVVPRISRLTNGPAICEVLNIARSQLLGERGIQTVLLSGMVHTPSINRELIQDGNYWNTAEQLSIKKCFSERKVLVRGKERVL